MHTQLTIKTDSVRCRDEAEQVWRKRRVEPGVIASCFYLFSHEQIAPKVILPEEWRVHTVYSPNPTPVVKQ